MENRHEEWWECANLACGHKILFRMLCKTRDKSTPTCFCGSGMKRPYAKPHCRRYADTLAIGLDRPTMSPPAIRTRVFVVPLRTRDVEPTRSNPA